MSEILVLCTAGTHDEAEKIAAALVENGEAACVNIVPGVRSIYRWEGKVCDTGEWLLLIKSTAGRFDAVRRRIHEMHSYELPEVIAVSIAAGDPDYLRWLSDQSTE